MSPPPPPHCSLSVPGLSGGSECGLVSRREGLWRKVLHRVLANKTKPLTASLSTPDLRRGCRDRQERLS